MEDRPKIPFVRKLYCHLTDDEIKEAEARLYDFYEWIKAADENRKLTNKDIELE